MPWHKIAKKETPDWNGKLKTTNAAFCQFPYYVASEYNSLLSKSVFIKYIQDDKEIAYAAIIEIGVFNFKVGVIDSGPVLLQNSANLQLIVADLKKFAHSQNYMHIQIRPPYNSPFNSVFNTDTSFDVKVHFPFHCKVEFDWNIYNKPEKELLAGFKLQGRRKIVLAARIPYKFFKVEDEKTLGDIRKIFKDVTTTKGYGFLPFKIYEAIYKEGKKYDLCDFYVAYLGNDLVNVVLIVKDGQSFYHYTSALVVKGYKPSESPPAKLHFFIMQDCFYNEHKSFYNISFGGSDNLIRFKELFNPIEIEKPPYYTYVARKNMLNFFTKFSKSRPASLRTMFKSIDNLFTKSSI